jgi:ferredoxin
VNRLKLIDAGLRAFDVRLPGVTPPLCLVTRYRASSCRRCLDVCPAAAAISTAPWLQVDPQSCTSCGACAAVCRTGALSFADRSIDVRCRLGEAAAAGAATVRFACRLVAAASRSASRETGAAATIVVPCLGGLSVGDLVGAATLGIRTVDLIDAGCEECADCAAGIAADATTQVATETLAAYGADLSVSRTTAAAPDGSGLTATPPAVAASATLSRRDLFAYVAHRVRRTVAEGTAPQKRPVADLHDQAPPGITRSWLGDDLATLAARGHVSPAFLPAALPFAHVSVSDACDGCGLCVRYCPHAAIRSQDGRVAAADALCTGCGLCVETCPREALSLEPAPAIN